MAVAEAVHPDTPPYGGGVSTAYLNLDEAPVFRRVLQAWRDRTLQDYDVVGLITGYPGRGKSCFLWHLGHLLDPRFDVSNVGWDFGEVIRATRGAQPGDFVAWDEGIEGLDNRRSTSRHNVDWSQWLMISRARCVQTWMALPDLQTADLRVRDQRALAWIEIERRGLATIHAWRLDEDGDRIYGDKPRDAWQPVVSVVFPDAWGAEWAAYKKRKAAFMARKADEMLVKHGGNGADKRG